MNTGSVVLYLVGAALLLALLVLGSAIRVVRQFERLVVLRLGRLQSVREPGLALLIPVLDKAVRVDLRERFREIPRQTCITKDNAPIGIDFLIYFRVIPEQAWRTVVEVVDLSGALVGMATTSLRAVIGDITLDDALAKRDQINQVLRVKLDEVTERWGAKVTAVEIREIEPPKAVQDAMNQQMAAERTRRATVTEAEGHRQAAITVAEGEKQSAILRAEGGRQSSILLAEGNRQAAMLNAEGYSAALGKIFEVAKQVDGNTMSLQYFETLKVLGGTAATKYVIPLELTSFMRPFVNSVAEKGSNGAPVGDAPPQG